MDHKGRTLLHAAALFDNCVVLLDLIKRGMGVDTIDKVKTAQTMLLFFFHCTVVGSHDCESVLFIQHGRTPLNLAIRAGNTEAALVLLANGANHAVADIVSYCFLGLGNLIV